MLVRMPSVALPAHAACNRAWSRSSACALRQHSRVPRLTTHLVQLAQQGLQERGLARAHRPQDAHELASRKLHIQIPQHRQLQAGR